MRAAWTSWWSLLTKRELAFEIGNPLRLFVELFAQAVVLALQSFNLARLAISGRPGRIVTRRSLRALRLHHPERTKLQRRYKYEISANIPQGLNCYVRRTAAPAGPSGT